jgi:hypothetical protein
METEDLKFKEVNLYFFIYKSCLEFFQSLLMKTEQVKIGDLNLVLSKLESNFNFL